MTNLKHERQLTLFGPEEELPRPPSTRYQGSKLKLLPWIWENIAGLQFHAVLDVFGGTGAVSYHLKSRGKEVSYNDYLVCNHLVGQALVENCDVTLSHDDVELIVRQGPAREYDDFIFRTFQGIYFTDDENAWLDVVSQNIPRLDNDYKRALAYYALFQSCIIKRPYNLFHRKNLYMRLADVRRGFGNKVTWDTPFDEHFRNFVAEVNDAVFDSGVPCEAFCRDALDVPGDYDLVYIDPPYVSKKGIGVDYFAFYHFLEGLVNYGSWPERVDYRRKHRPLRGTRSPWSDAKRTRDAFRRLFERYADSILVVSYRSDGIPSQDALLEMLRRVKGHARAVAFGRYKYVLSTNGASKELLLIGQ